MEAHLRETFMDNLPSQFNARGKFCNEVFTQTLTRCYLRSFPSINGPFSDERRSPRVSVCGVLSVRLNENPCAALLIRKTPHL
jgi:hypothetical protein